MAQVVGRSWRSAQGTKAGALSFVSWRVVVGDWGHPLKALGCAWRKKTVLGLTTLGGATYPFAPQLGEPKPSSTRLPKRPANLIVMHFPLITASLTLGALLAVPPQDATPQAPAAEPVSTPADDLGGPLKVGDVEINELDVKRYLIYGPCRSALEYRRVNAILQDEANRRIASYADDLATWEAINASGADAGPKPKQYTQEYYNVTDEAFEAMYTVKIADFEKKYPTLELDVEVARAFRSPRWHKRELRQEMLFDRTFVPDNPADWPALTFEALRQEAGDILIDDFRESYERRAAELDKNMAEWNAAAVGGADPGPKPVIRAEDSMYRSILRQIVRDTVFGVCDTKTSMDGIDPSIAVSMDMDYDGEPDLVVTVDELWNDVRDTVTRREINDARRYLALIEATRQRLANEGKLLTDEEAESHMEAVRASFGSDVFGISTQALAAHQFPSVEAYAAYMPLIEGYKKSVAPLMASPAEGGLSPVLRGHLDHCNQVMGLSKVDAEVLLVSAFDFDKFEWIEDGWQEAKKKAAWLKTEIEKNAVAYANQRKQRLEAAAAGEDFTPTAEVLDPPDFWARLLDEHCDFWDPPPPAEGKPGSDHGYKKNGRLGERTRNDLRSMLSESPFTNFLYGGLLTDEIYFRQDAGSIVGPLRGPHGFYLTKVLKRVPTQRPLNINDEKHLELLREDWVRMSFIVYAHEALDAADVSGLGSQK